MYIKDLFRFLIIVLSFACSWAEAQYHSLKFDHLTIEDGLSSNRVNCIYRDSKDYLWISTGTGLDRFDSYKFTAFRHNSDEKRSISSDIVRCIYEDGEKNLWFGTDSGLNLFDRTTKTFRVFRSIASDSSSLNGNYIYSILQDKAGNLWVNTDGNCLNKWLPEEQCFKRYPFDYRIIELQTAPTHVIAEDSKGNLWIVYAGRGVLRFDPISRTFTKFDDPSVDFGTNSSKSLFIDHEDKLWIATDGKGLLSYDPVTDVFEQYGTDGDGKGTNQDIVLDIIPENDRFLLLAVNQGGINRFDKVSKTFEYIMYDEANSEGLNNNGVICFHKDKEGILWVGTTGGGINYYNPKKRRFNLVKHHVNNSQSLSYDFTGCFCEDHKGMVWIGTDGGGINVYDPETGNFKIYRHNPDDPYSVSGNVIRSIAEDKDHDIWIATWDAGLNRFDRRTGRFYHYMPKPNDPHSISSEIIWTLTIDHHGIIWLGYHNGGIDLFNKKKGVIKRFRADADDPGVLSHNGIRQIVEDTEQNIWVCTWMGLNLYDSINNTFKVFKKFPDNDILSFYQDRNGNYWAGTNKSGICRFATDGTVLETYDVSVGLPDNTICAVVEDNSNNLWISTNNGISRLNYRTHSIRNYSKEDGLQSNNFFVGSYLKTRKGEIYFGGYSGFNSFHPDSLKENEFIPFVYIDEFRIFDKPITYSVDDRLNASISEAEEIHLFWRESVFSLSFVGINYTYPGNNNYKYILEGFDKEWILRDASRRSVTYTNLDPGTYTFRVKVSNNDGIWNEQGAYINIIIHPPWWKTWWFRAILYTVLVGLAFLAYYIRFAFYRNQRVKLQALVKERTMQLEEVAISLEEKQEEINSQNEELKSQRDELDRHRNQLEQLVEERTRELILAKEKAVESDQLKSSFLANLSHEIRTPLNAILGFSDLLGEKDISDKERKEYNQIIRNSSNTLLSLINDILDISKIDAGQMELVLEPVHIETVVRNLTDVFNILMKTYPSESGNQVSLKVNINAKVLGYQIITDKRRLEQVLSNLISNALKFTHQGFIEIGCNRSPDGDMLEFYVKDTGIGIHEEYLNVIFDRFRKLEDDKRQLHRGTGLGLAISSQLVNLLGGTMRVSSKIGEGSVFYFTIPLVLSGKPKRRPGTSVNDTLPDLQKYTILVAEDDKSNYFYIERLLRKTKATIIRAENGKEVLTTLRNQAKVDLILMDIKMPEMDGTETLHELRKMNIQVPVIAQTAYALADEVLKLKKEGFNDYLSKPINPDEFYCKIKQCIDR